MPKVIVTSSGGATLAIDAVAGKTLLVALRDAVAASGINEDFGRCGGCCTCYTCHVWIDEAHLGRLITPSDQEAELLDLSEHRQANSRLACQIPLTEALDGIGITLPPVA